MLRVVKIDMSNTLVEIPKLTDYEIKKFNEWVLYDESTNTFGIKNGVENYLTQSEYKFLSECLIVTNSNIEKADFSTG